MPKTRDELLTATTNSTAPVTVPATTSTTAPVTMPTAVELNTPVKAVRKPVVKTESTAPVKSESTVESNIVVAAESNIPVKTESNTSTKPTSAIPSSSLPFDAAEVARLDKWAQDNSDVVAAMTAYSKGEKAYRPTYLRAATDPKIGADWQKYSQLQKARKPQPIAAEVPTLPATESDIDIANKYGVRLRGVGSQTEQKLTRRLEEATVESSMKLPDINVKDILADAERVRRAKEYVAEHPELAQTTSMTDEQARRDIPNYAQWKAYKDLADSDPKFQESMKLKDRTVAQIVADAAKRYGTDAETLTVALNQRDIPIGTMVERMVDTDDKYAIDPDRVLYHWSQRTGNDAASAGSAASAKANLTGRKDFEAIALDNLNKGRIKYVMTDEAGLMALDPTLVPQVNTPGEQGYAVAQLIIDGYAKTGGALSWWNPMEQTHRGYLKFLQDRVKTLTSRENVKPGDANYDAVSKAALNRAIAELAAAKTVGLWTSTAYLPETADPEQASFKDAVLPSLEVIGISVRRDGSLNVVTRQESRTNYFFNTMDTAQAAVSGVLRHAGDETSQQSKDLTKIPAQMEEAKKELTTAKTIAVPLAVWGLATGKNDEEVVAKYLDLKQNAKTGILTRDNLMNLAMESDWAQPTVELDPTNGAVTRSNEVSIPFTRDEYGDNFKVNWHTLVAGTGGLAGMMFFPDATDVVGGFIGDALGGAAKLSSASKAKRASAVLDDITAYRAAADNLYRQAQAEAEFAKTAEGMAASTARGRSVELKMQADTAWRNAASAESDLRESFPQIADELDRIDASIANGVAAENPSILDRKLASRLPVQSSENVLLTLHPSERRSALKTPEDAGFQYQYKRMYDTHDVVKEVEKIESIDKAGGRVAALTAESKDRLQKLRGIIGDVGVKNIVDDLPSAINDPEAWRKAWIDGRKDITVASGEKTAIEAQIKGAIDRRLEAINGQQRLFWDSLTPEQELVAKKATTVEQLKDAGIDTTAYATMAKLRGEVQELRRPELFEQLVAAETDRRRALRRQYIEEVLNISSQARSINQRAADYESAISAVLTNNETRSAAAEVLRLRLRATHGLGLQPWDPILKAKGVVKSAATDVYRGTIPAEDLPKLKALLPTIGDAIRNGFLGLTEEAYRSITGNYPVSRPGRVMASKFRKHFGLSKEQSLYVATIVDSVARGWAKANGSTVDKWYKTHIADVVNGFTGETRRAERASKLGLKKSDQFIDYWRDLQTWNTTIAKTKLTDKDAAVLDELRKKHKSLEKALGPVDVKAASAKWLKEHDARYAGKLNPRVKKQLARGERLFQDDGYATLLAESTDISKLAVPDGFFSPLQRAIGNVIKKSGGRPVKPSFLMREVRKQPGIKEDEILWSGIEEFLAGKERVGIEDVSDWLKRREPIVEVKGAVGKLSPEKQAIADEKAAADTALSKAHAEGREFRDTLHMPEYESGRWLQDALNNADMFLAGEDRFRAAGGYQGIHAGDKINSLPVDFRERLRAYLNDVYAPAAERADAATRRYVDEIGPLESSRFEKYVAPGESSNYREIRFIQPGSEGPGRGASQHFEKNTIAHLRTTDRIDDQGRKILFIEETQSDWHQAGVKRGYETPEVELDSELLKARAAQDAALNRRRAVYERVEHELLKDEAYAKAKRDFDRTGSDRHARVLDRVRSSAFLRLPRDILDEVSTAEAELVEADRRLSTRGGDAPKVRRGTHSELWRELAVKQALAIAAKEGYDGVAITRGPIIQSVVGGDFTGQVEFYDTILPGTLKNIAKSAGAPMSTTGIRLGSQIDEAAVKEIVAAEKEVKRRKKELEAVEEALTKLGNTSRNEDEYVDAQDAVDEARSAVDESQSKLDDLSAYSVLSSKVDVDEIQYRIRELERDLEAAIYNGKKDRVSKIKQDIEAERAHLDELQRPLQVPFVPVTDKLKKTVDEGLPLYQKSENAETSVRQGKLGLDKRRIVELLGASMYSGDIGGVTVKELLQNSFDATKAAESRGLIQRGEILVDIDDATNVIKVSDNGIGMTPEVVQSAFFTIAGTDKADLPPHMRSGGLGLAKMAFLLGSERIKLETVRDGIRTIVETTPKDIVNDAFLIKTERITGSWNAPENAHFKNPRTSGTTITITLPKEYIDPKTGEARAINVSRYPAALHNPLVGNVEVRRADSYTGGFVPTSQGVNVDLSAYDLLTNVKFSWGEADVYVDRNRAEYPRKSILSSGLHQFDSYSLAKELKHDVIVDIKPSVSASENSYPFNNQREGFKSTIKADIEALEDYLESYGSRKEAEAVADVFRTAQPMQRVALEDLKRARATAGGFIAPDPTTVRRVETTVKTPTEPTRVVIKDGSVKSADKPTRTIGNVRDEAASFKPERAKDNLGDLIDSVGVDPKRPLYLNNTNVDYVNIVKQRLPESKPEEFLSELGSLVVEFKERTAKAGGSRYAILDRPGTIYASGIAIDKSYRGVHVKVPFKAFFINPLALSGKTPIGVAEGALHTLLHEAVHTVDMSHNESFTTHLADIYEAMGDTADIQAFRQALTNTVSRHWQTFEEMRNAYRQFSTVNLAKSMESGEKLAARTAGSADADLGGSLGVGLAGRVDPGADEAAARGARLAEGESISGPSAREVIQANVDKLKKTVDEGLPLYQRAESSIENDAARKRMQLESDFQAASARVREKNRKLQDIDYELFSVKSRLGMDGMSDTWLKLVADESLRAGPKVGPKELAKVEPFVQRFAQLPIEEQERIKSLVNSANERRKAVATEYADADAELNRLGKELRDFDNGNPALGWTSVGGYSEEQIEYAGGWRQGGLSRLRDQTTAVGAARILTEYATDPIHRHIAEKLTRVLDPNETFQIKRDFPTELSQAAGFRRYAQNSYMEGYKAGGVWLKSGVGETAQVTLHELTHSATANQIRRYMSMKKGNLSARAVGLTREAEAACSEIVELHKYVKDFIEKNPSNFSFEFDRYGLTNPLEFVAEAFADASFQEALRRIPARNQPDVSLWDAFLSKLRILLGLDTLPPSVLDEVIDSTARVVDMNRMELDSIQHADRGYLSKHAKDIQVDDVKRMVTAQEVEISDLRRIHDEASAYIAKVAEENATLRKPEYDFNDVTYAIMDEANEQLITAYEDAASAALLTPYDREKAIGRIQSKLDNTDPADVNKVFVLTTEIEKLRRPPSVDEVAQLRERLIPAIVEKLKTSDHLFIEKLTDADKSEAGVRRMINDYEKYLSEAPSINARIDENLKVIDGTGERLKKLKSQINDEEYKLRSLNRSLEAAQNQMPQFIDDVLYQRGDELIDDLPDVDAASVPADAKGAVQFLSDGRAVIFAFRQPDVTTVIHELGHIFRRDLPDADRLIIEEWAGVVDGVWTVDAEEKFARGFERYMAEGKSPASALDRVFEKMKTWMREIYKAISGSSIDIDMTPEVKGVFDRLLGAGSPDTAPLNVWTHIKSELSKQGIPFNIEAGKKQIDATGNLILPAGGKVDGLDIFTTADISRIQGRIDDAAELKKAPNQPALHLDSAKGQVVESTAVDKARGFVEAKVPESAFAQAALSLMFGGDPDRKLRYMPGVMRKAVARGTYHVMSALQDSMRIAHESGLPELAKYLTGERLRYRAGRDIPSSGYNFFSGAMSEFVDFWQKLDEKDRRLIQAICNENVPEKMLGLDYVTKSIKKVLYDPTTPDFIKNSLNVIAAIPEKAIKAGTGPADKERQLLRLLLQTTGQLDPKVRIYNAAASDVLEMTSKGIKETVGDKLAIPGPKPGQAALDEIFDAQVGIDGIAGIDTQSADRFLTAIADIYGEPAATKMGIVLAGAGAEHRAFDSMFDSGIVLDKKDAAIFKKRLMGERLPPKLEAKADEIAQKFGLNPMFKDFERVAGKDYVVPSVAKNRLAGINRSFADEMAAASRAGEAGVVDATKSAGERMLGNIVRYMHGRMVRGGLLERQTFYLNQVVDHMNGIFMMAGLRPAIVSTARFIAQNLLVLTLDPSNVISVGRGLHTAQLATGAEIVQAGLKHVGLDLKGKEAAILSGASKLIQSGSDVFARALAKLLGIGKYRVEVNDVLKGGDKLIHIGDASYTADELRRIALEGELFSNMGGSAVGKVFSDADSLRLEEKLQGASKLTATAMREIRNAGERLFETPEEIAELVSTHERIGAYVTLIEAGLTPRQAADLVGEGLLKYGSTLSPNDRNPFVKMLVPFWPYIKNANVQITNLIFSPYGAYRLGVMRRFWSGGADMLTGLSYSSQVDPYGIDESVLPPSEVEKYYALRFNIEAAFGGANKVPEEVRLALRAALAGQVTAFHNGQVFEIDDYFRRMVTENPEVVKAGVTVPIDSMRVATASVPPPDKATRSDWMRDRDVIRVTPTLTDKPLEAQIGAAEEHAARVYAKLKAAKSANPSSAEVDQLEAERQAVSSELLALYAKRGNSAMQQFYGSVHPDHPMTEILIPDHNYRSAATWMSNMLAWQIMSVAQLVDRPDALTEDEPYPSSMDYVFSSTPLKTLVDPTRAPLTSDVLGYMGVSNSGGARRVHPALASFVESSLPIVLTRVSAEKDPFVSADGADGLMVAASKKDLEYYNQETRPGAETLVANDPLVTKPLRYYAGGPAATLFYNTPLGEINEKMLAAETTPYETAAGGWHLLLPWARTQLGLKTMETQQSTGRRETGKREEVEWTQQSGKPKSNR